MAPFRVLFVLGLGCTLVAAAEPSMKVPARGLEAYVEFDGLDAHRAGWNATAAHAILDETPAGAMIVALIGQAADRELRRIAAARLRGEEVQGLVRHLARLGFVVAIHRQQETSPSITVVLPGAGRDGSRERFERFLRPLVQSKQATRLQLRGRERFQVVGERAKDQAQPAHSTLVWWFDPDDLVILVNASAAQLHAVLDTVERKTASATGHPGRLAAIAEGKAIAGFEPDGLFFVETARDGIFQGAIKNLLESLLMDRSPVTGRRGDRVEDLLSELDGLRAMDAPSLDLPPRAPPFPSRFPPPDAAAPPVPGEIKNPEKPVARPVDRASKPADQREDPVKLLGLDGITRIVGGYGFHGKALLNVVRVEAQAPRRGLVASLDGPPFRKESMPPLPRQAKSFVVAGFDPVNAYARAAALLKRLEPDLGEVAAQYEAALKELTGIQSGRELLAHVGPSWSLIHLEDPRHEGRSNSVVIAPVRNPEALLKALDAAAARFNETLRQRDARAEDANRGQEKDRPSLVLERLEAPERGYWLTSPSGLVPFFTEEGLEPTIVVGNKSLAIALHASVARAALSAEANPAQAWEPAAEARASFAIVPENLVMLSYRDPGESTWPGWLATMPHVVQLVVNELDRLERPDTAVDVDLLALLGLPEPGGFRVRLAPSEIPTIGPIRARLFPGVMAVSRDDRGIRWIVREAMPTVLPPMVRVTIKSRLGGTLRRPKWELKCRTEIGISG